MDNNIIIVSNNTTTTSSSSNWFAYILEDYWNKHGDPRVARYYLMKSFRPVLAILAIWFIFVLYLGPRCMRNRAPFALKRILLVYNLFVSLTNFYFFIMLSMNFNEVFPRIFDTRYPTEWKVDARELYIIDQCYLYFISKLIDLCDTVFFVLRKKRSQITGLHLYHHFSVVFFGWIYYRLFGTVNLLIPFSLMNTLIHTMMYGYYALAAMGPGMRKYLWWKRYITQVQIAQFVVLLVHGVYFVVNQQGYPVIFQINQILQVSIYLVLFTRFYIQSYTKTSTKTIHTTSNYKATIIKYD